MEWKEDKIKHMIISLLLVVISWLFTQNILYAMIISLSIGILKEVYDEFFSGPKSHWDPEDIFADLVGILIGAGICNLI